MGLFDIFRRKKIAEARREQAERQEQQGPPPSLERSVSNLHPQVRDAARLGFARMKARAEFNALPRGLKQQLMEKTGRGIEAIEEEYVEEAARLTLAGRPDGPEKKDEAMRNLMARLAQGKR